MTDKTVKIIGAGLAGSECALFLANHGVKVKLYEMKKIKKSPAHKSQDFAELVCSNSLKSVEDFSAGGELKNELQILGSKILEIAYFCRVPAGGALAVNREDFSAKITEEIKNNSNIQVIDEVVDTLCNNEITVVATGPLTDKNLLDEIEKLTGENCCHFFDAMAPIIDAQSLDEDCCYQGNRYNKGEGYGDYINCPLTKSEYEEFYNQLISAKTIELKDFENINVFEGCMPVEIMAKRGFDALRFGPLKPVGLIDNRTNTRSFAVVQLRKENIEGTMLNMVGFQTNLMYPEQKRVFSLIPALKNAEFLKYGAMHRNSYVFAPKVLTEFSSLKKAPNIFIAGQLSGVEGYVESFASGLFVGYNVLNLINGKNLVKLPKSTCLGGIISYITSYIGSDFQPMNANFGVMPAAQLETKDKKLKHQLMCERALRDMKEFERSYFNG